MRRIAAVYLAGPDGFLPDGKDILARKHALCAEAGLVGVTGAEAPLVETEPSEAMAREIYLEALARLRACDAVVANLTPWRGVGCDPGTAFEVGFAAALGKPVFAYANVTSEEEADLRGRVEMLLGAAQDEDGRWRDPEGAEIEDFGLPENLMLWAEARRFYVIICEDPLADVTGVQLCLEALKAYALEA